MLVVAAAAAGFAVGVRTDRPVGASRPISAPPCRRRALPRRAARRRRLSRVRAAIGRTRRRRRSAGRCNCSIFRRVDFRRTSAK
eukprot:819307-Prymnesium_polylepis.1